MIISYQNLNKPDFETAKIVRAERRTKRKTKFFVFYSEAKPIFDASQKYKKTQTQEQNIYHLLLNVPKFRNAKSCLPTAALRTFFLKTT